MNLGSNLLESVTSGRRRSSKGDPDKAFSWQDGIRKRIFYDDKEVIVKKVSYRIASSYFLLVLVILILTAGLFNLQVTHGERNFTLSEGNRIRIQIIRPERGLIYDRNGNVVARNSPGFKVGLDLGILEEDNVPKVVRKLSEILSLKVEEINQKIEEDTAEGKTQSTIQEGIPRELIFKIEANQESFPGVFIEVSPVREYLYPEILAHVLGYTGEISKEELSRFNTSSYVLGDRIGKTGLENIYEEYLRGIHGKRLLEIDAYGKVLEELAKRESIPGDSLILTLDVKLQKVAAESLKKYMEKHKASAGVVIALNPQTGEILALVNYPSFDPNKFSRTLPILEYEKIVNDKAMPLLNRALTSAYPPGSTFKMITASAALEEGIVSPKTQIEEVQTISVGTFTFSNWTLSWGVPPHGRLNIVKALAYSSDIFFYEVGGGYENQLGLGANKMAKWAKKFGLGELTQIDLTGEVAGLVPTEEWKKEVYKEPWYLGDSYVMAIGQGYVLATPLQIANVTATVANMGRLLKPFLVKEVKDHGGNTKTYFESTLLRENFASKETLNLVRQGMREAVTYGTSAALKDFKVPVAGKTGTSETGDPNKNHAWFTAFAPFEKSEIVVTVFLEEGGNGSIAALPVAKEIFEEYFSVSGREVK